MEPLTPEVAPFGSRTMVVEPGFFRTDLLTPESTSYADSSTTTPRAPSRPSRPGTR
jgi:hypothetical protein